MVNENKNITKVCSFYASDWHLITMLLPHINKTIDVGAKITTILEEDAQDKVETLLQKLKLYNTKKILNINWRKKELDNINIENDNNEKIEFIISGSSEYINKANELIENYVKTKEIKSEIKIINCYFAEENLDIKEILNNHKAVLNTAGEKTTAEFMRSISMIG